LRGRPAAGGIALLNSVGVIGGFVAPYMVGALRDITGAPAWSMYALATSWLVAALLTLFLPRKTQL
jgi:nitrate/nitrite transporter NarK